MKFGVLVQSGPYMYEGTDSAYHFTKAALEKGHEIVGVFFYCDGVITASKLADIQQDERHIQKRWSELAENNNLDMIVCIAAGKLRGINDDVLAPGFRISGLGQLAEIAIKADRLVTFGA